MDGGDVEKENRDYCERGGRTLKTAGAFSLRAGGLRYLPTYLASPP